MAAITNTLQVKVKLAWWLCPYLYGVACMCTLTGSEPSQERMSYWIGKGVRIKVI